MLFCEADSNELKVIDFALSRNIFDTGIFLKSCNGASYYFAAEVLRHNQNEKWDACSSGAILHCMLVGFPLFICAKQIKKYW